MPRRYREESPTGFYHVMTRGINKDNIFSSKLDKKYIVKVIREKSSGVFCKIYSYCIMDNHIHLLIESSLHDLSLLMKKINTSYAFYYNSGNDRVGSVFQGRFRSEIIHNEKHLAGVIRYIHNNPVKAKMVSKPESYRWSSMKEYIENENDIIDRDALEFIRENFKTTDSFREFHLIKDEENYLEIEEELIGKKDDLGKKIVAGYLKQVGKEGVEELQNKDELIIGLLKEEKFTYREIADLVGCSVGKISNVNKVLRP